MAGPARLTPTGLQPGSAESFSTFVQGVPAAKTPLTGTELVPVIQNGFSVHASPNDFGGNFLHRTTLTANTNYYVTTTGNDSNPGTLASPWATLQHACNFISSNIDIGPFFVKINIGAGIFVGAVVNFPIGSGFMVIVGAGPGTTTIQNGGSGSCLSIPTCPIAFLCVGNLTLDANTANCSGIAPGGGPAVIFITDETFSNVAPVSITASGGGGFACFDNNADAVQIISVDDVTISGNWQCAWYLGNVTCYDAPVGNIIFSGTPNWVQGYLLAFGGQYEMDGTFSGTSTGPAMSINGFTLVHFNNPLPGNSRGHIIDGELRDGNNAFPATIESFYKSASISPSSILPGDGETTVFKDGNQATATNGLAFYANDNGTVFPLTPVRTTFANLPNTPHQGDMASISDGNAANCGDASCTTFGTSVTGGGGALNLLIWYNGTHWTLMGK